MRRTHTCGDLAGKDVGKEVTLQGWVNTRRDHGGIIFIDLRDRYGMTQLRFDPKAKKAHEEAQKLRREFVIEAKGRVIARPKGMENPKLKTGAIEVDASDLRILNPAETPPFEIDDRSEINEDARLKYRFLDLRRPEMQRNLLMRHRVAKSARDFFDSENFIEVETPILSKSTPEGARDYLVPSRVHPGKFFALPQSPQLFKQLLMVAGYDRYVQIAKCFRDEDLRADRQPEFTQIDVEMSFVEAEDIMGMMERLIKKIWKDAMGIDLKVPFLRITYHDAMERFGSDKPDVRYALELVEVGDVMAKSDFQVFKSVLERKGMVKCINAKGCAELSRKDIDELTQLVAIYGAKGLAWAKMADKLEGTIVKFMNEGVQKELIARTKAEKGDLLLFVADKPKIVYDSLGALRIELAKRLKLIDKSKFSFIWIYDFPLFEWDEEEQRLAAVHHPFTSPRDEDVHLLDTDPAKAKAKAYDLALNGVELGGGSIRIHQSDVQSKIFSLMKITPNEAKLKFGFLLDAFTYGAPPHGGLAFGLDRMVAMIVGQESIREVIAFPKNKACQSLMDDSPSEVGPKQMKELHIDLNLPKKKE